MVEIIGMIIIAFIVLLLVVFVLGNLSDALDDMEKSFKK
jgi:uncharacterized protein YoxC